MYKLYKITVNERDFYIGATGLDFLAKEYPNATKIEFISEKVVFNSSDRYNLIKLAHTLLTKGFERDEKEQLIKSLKKHIDYVNG